MRQLRIYADTSVFGGCFDDEFAQESILLFKEIKIGKFILVTSATLIGELQEAPEQVQKILTELPRENVEYIDFSEEISFLRDEYLKAGIVGAASRGDAEHIACATVAEVDFVVSWNFKHIVHYDKINAYQAVNLIQGYKQIRIYSPKEVVNDEG